MVLLCHLSSILMHFYKFMCQTFSFISFNSCKSIYHSTPLKPTNYTWTSNRVAICISSVIYGSDKQMIHVLIQVTRDVNRALLRAEVFTITVTTTSQFETDLLISTLWELLYRQLQIHWTILVFCYAFMRDQDIQF
jgi:hypothetical protein